MFLTCRGLCILHRQREHSADLSIGPGREAETPRLGKGLQPRGKVDRVAEEVAIVNDDVPDVDADAEPQATAVRQDIIPSSRS